MTLRRSGRARGRRGWAGCRWLAALTVAGCGASGSPGTGELPPSPPVLSVTMDEYTFTHAPTVAPGRVVVEAVNGGTVDHALTLVGLPDDMPPIVEQLRGDVRRPVVTFAEIPRQAPGRRGTFAVDLDPGRYALVCFLVDADGVTHAAKGMASEFRVVG